MIKHEAYTDGDLAQLPMATRFFFVGLPTIADKEGRLEDRPLEIKAKLFPFDDVDIDEMLGQLARPKAFSKEPFIYRYAVNGRRYVQIVNFVKHQNPHPKEKKSVIPPPPPEAMESNGITCNSTKSNEISPLPSGSSDPDPDPDPDPEDATLLREACPEATEAPPTNAREEDRVASIEDIEGSIETWLMELAYWMPAQFSSHTLSPKYVELVFNLTNCGNEKGATAVQPGQMPYSLEELTDAIRGFIVANHEDRWYLEQRNKGSPRNLLWLLSHRDQISKHAEIGRERWARWSQREQRRRDAREQLAGKATNE